MAGYKPPRATAREFIEAWQTSDTVVKVARKLRMTTAQVRVRACRYRRHGVPLKPYLFPDYPNWDDLADFAKSFLPPESDGEPKAAPETGNPDQPGGEIVS
jgi:hypothetical protein